MITPKGKNIMVEVNPSEKITDTGIIIPDTATPEEQEWGTVKIGSKKYEEGSRVLYYGTGLYQENGLKIVPEERVLLCLK